MPGIVNLAINRKINVQKGGDIYYSGSIYLDEYGVFILHKIMYSVTFSCTHCSSVSIFIWMHAS